ncbi:transposable element Tcb2 transposase [Trichonephila clavipes]|nr:transposable element Tcb2 transposase [Trichonephila clavipes]
MFRPCDFGKVWKKTNIGGHFLRKNITHKRRTVLPTGGRLINLWGCGSPVVKVSDHGSHVMSSSSVPLKTRRVGQRCVTADGNNASSAQTLPNGKKEQYRELVPREEKKDGNWCAKHPLMTCAHSQQETMGSKQGSRQKLLGAVDTRRYPHLENRVWSDQELRGTTRSEDRRIVRQALVDPTVTRSTIRADVGISIVRQTISRHLAEANRKSKCPFRVLPLTPEHRQLRLQWCQGRSMWNVTDWQKVVFRDESRFFFGTDDNRVRVWRCPGERYNSPHTVLHHTARTAGVMVWGS